MSTATNFTSRSSSLQSYLNDLQSFHLIDATEEQRLARLIQDNGDEGAVRQLVEANLNFVITIAKQYTNLGIPFEDLLNEGNLGLIEAARRFDPDRGTRFITYAVWWIRRSILQTLTYDSRTVRIPKYKVKELREFNLRRSDLRTKHDREPTRQEISEAAGMTIEAVDRMLSLQSKDVSLDAPSKVTDLPLTETLPAEQNECLESSLFRREACDRVRQAMEYLNERERRILDLRYGFENDNPKTLEQIGQTLNLTKERVRQIEIRARKRMKNILSSQAEEVTAMAAG